MDPKICSRATSQPFQGEKTSLLNLQVLDLTLAPIHLDSLGGQGHHAHLLLALLARRRIDGETVSGGLGLHPIERAARQGIPLDAQCFPKTAELTELAQAAFPNLKIFRCEAAHMYEAGASETQELAIMAGAAATYMRLMMEAGLDANAAARAIEARLAADADIHLTIAKLRAARRIFARIAESFGATGEARRLSLHATTAGRMLSASDAWTNLIRHACAGFAAAAGLAVVLYAANMAGIPTGTKYWFALPVTPVYANQAKFLLRAGQANAAPVTTLPESNLARAGNGDVYTFFIESYGAVTHDRPEMRSALEQDYTRSAATMAASGWQGGSAFVDSPTSRAASWPAHVTLPSPHRL